MRTRFAVSERRACSVIEVDRMMVRYRSTRPDDGTLRERLKALAQERRRSVTGACTCCCAVKGMRSTTSACSGSTGRSG